jgi:hypothetical protein
MLSPHEKADSYHFTYENEINAYFGRITGDHDQLVGGKHFVLAGERGEWSWKCRYALKRPTG